MSDKGSLPQYIKFPKEKIKRPTITEKFTRDINNH